MLAHSPPLPLIIDYLDESHEITAEDEENIMLALQHHDRVRRIRLQMPILNLRKFIIAIDEEFPMLEYLYIGNLANAITRLILPETFRAPQSTAPLIGERRRSYRIPISFRCRWPRHIISVPYPTIRLFPPQ